MAAPRAASALPFRTSDAAFAPGQPMWVARATETLSGPALESAAVPAVVESHVVESQASETAAEAAPLGADCCTLIGGVRACDEMVVINTRSVGCSCDPEVLRQGLGCEVYVPSGECCRVWQPADLMTLLTSYDPGKVTVIYVHGNQISPSLAKHRGKLVYRRMLQCGGCDQPIRFIVFSWPSSEIKGALKDIRVKAARTCPAGCQLAWVIDQMPADQPLGLIGYSYGPRIITGALHILAGGTLSGCGLAERSNPGRPPVRVVLVAAALHAHWLGPGQYHGLAMSQVESVLFVNNCQDRAMKFYKISTTNGSPQAMGLRGPTCIDPAERHKIRSIDVSRHVGANHDEEEYICVPGTPCRFWSVVE